MSIEKRRRWTLACLTGAIVFAAALSLRSATIEVENDDDNVDAPPTPSAQSPSPAPAVKPAKPTAPQAQSPAVAPPPAPPLGSTALPPVAETVPAQKRVRIGENVGFYYFLKAGFVADPSKTASLGKVIGSFDYNTNYTTPKRTYIEMSSSQTKVSPGDLLVIYRGLAPIEEPATGTSGTPVEDQAIVKVVEVQDQRALVEVFKSFRPFQTGDPVELYENEIRRWKQAQTKKILPSHAVTCFVAGGETGMQEYEQLGYIYLSAGAKKGVVEGQTFQLREPIATGALEEPLRVPRGKVEVISVGPDFSTAMILTNDESIRKGFEADYEP